MPISTGPVWEWSEADQDRWRRWNAAYSKVLNAMIDQHDVNTFDTNIGGVSWSIASHFCMAGDEIIEAGNLYDIVDDVDTWTGVWIGIAQKLYGVTVKI